MTISSPIRVLIVDAGALSVRELAARVVSMPDMELLGSSQPGPDVIDLIRREHPDAVLLDIDLLPDAALSVIDAIRTDGSIGVVLLSAYENEAVIRSAMQMGVRGYLRRPFDHEALHEMIVDTVRHAREASERRLPLDQTMLPANRPASSGETATVSVSAAPGSRRHRIVALFSPRGGSGRTTLAVNLACVLSEREAPVALVDGHLQFGDLGLLLDISVDASPITDHVEWLPDSGEAPPVDALESVFVPQRVPGLHLVVSPLRPELAQLVKPDHLRGLLSGLRAGHSYTIVDLPAQIDDVTLAALDAADVIVVVGFSHIQHLRGLRSLTRLFSDLSYDEKVVLVLNRASFNFGIARSSAENAIGRAFDLAIPHDDRVLGSINQGEPLVFAAPRSAFSVAVRKIADHIVTRFPARGS